MDNNTLSQLSELSQLLRFDHLVLFLLSIALLVALVKALQKIAEYLYVKLPSRRLLISQIVTSLNFIIYIFGGTFLFYAIMQPPKELMIAVAGSAAVALGLSLKDLVSSVIAGFILLFDRPFVVGDRVHFGDTYGEITSIGLRAVRLVTLDDNEVTIPNSRFMTDVVASGNAGAIDMMVTMDFHIRIDMDVRKARDLLYEVVVTSRYVYMKKPVSIVISEVEIAERLAVQLRAKAYVLDVRFEKAFQTDVNLRAGEVFKSQGIERPRPV